MSEKRIGYYTNWASSYWLTFWDEEASGDMKEMQRLVIDKEISFYYFAVKNFPKICLLLATRMYNRTNSDKIDIDGEEAKELLKVFEMFIEDVNSVWLKKEE